MALSKKKCKQISDTRCSPHEGPMSPSCELSSKNRCIFKKVSLKKKECPSGKILNPKTNRCIKDPSLKKTKTKTKTKTKSKTKTKTKSKTTKTKSKTKTKTTKTKSNMSEAQLKSLVKLKKAVIDPNISKIVVKKGVSGFNNNLNYPSERSLDNCDFRNLNKKTVFLWILGPDGGNVSTFALDRIYKSLLDSPDTTKAMTEMGVSDAEHLRTLGEDELERLSDLVEIVKLTHISFTNCDFSTADLGGLDFSYCRFDVGCLFDGTTFNNTILMTTMFIDCNMKGVNVYGAVINKDTRFCIKLLTQMDGTMMEDVLAATRVRPPEQNYQNDGNSKYKLESIIIQKNGPKINIEKTIRTTSLSESKKKELPKLLHKYIEANKDKDGRFYIEEWENDFELVLDIGDIANIIKYKQDIDVLEPTKYSEVTTLNINNNMFKSIDKWHPYGDFNYYHDLNLDPKDAYWTVVRDNPNLLNNVENKWHEYSDSEGSERDIMDSFAYSGYGKHLWFIANETLYTFLKKASQNYFKLNTKLNVEIKEEIKNKEQSLGFPPLYWWEKTWDKAAKKWVPAPVDKMEGLLEFMHGSK